MMLKVSTAVAVAALMTTSKAAPLSTMSEIHETAQLFKVTVHENEIIKLRTQVHNLEKETFNYVTETQSGTYGKLLAQDIFYFSQTNEFQDFGEFITNVKKHITYGDYVSTDVHHFVFQYKEQLEKTQKAYKKVKGSVKFDYRGSGPDRMAQMDIDNEDWYRFNVEYYKLKQIEFQATKLRIFKEFKSKVTALRKTVEFETIEFHWLKLTQTKQHQVVIKHQAAMIVAMMKCLHVNKKDKDQIDVRESPVVFDVFHALFVYFKFAQDGDLNPMLDYITEAKYNEEFVETVDPNFEQEFDEKASEESDEHSVYDKDKKLESYDDLFDDDNDDHKQNLFLY